MQAERNAGTAADAAASSTDAPAGQAEITYHKAPSMLWFIIPFLALLAYGYFSH